MYCFDVHSQIVPLAVRFSTKFALESSDFFVKTPDMISQILDLKVCFVTQMTLMSSKSFVNTLDVKFQLRQTRVGFSTLWAHFFIVLVINFDVV